MKFSTLILRSIFTISIISTFLAFGISIYFQYNNFTQDKVYIKNESIEQKKEIIKREVLRVHELIDYRQKLIRQNVEKKLITRIDQAYSIATSIYEENKDKKSTEELKYLIVTALKNISFNEKRSYFYINTVDGKAVLFLKKSKLNENKNVWNFKDVKGNYVVRRHVDIALSKTGEGFAINHFKKPDLNDNKEYPKISYIKYFKPLNWYLGMGEYLDDMENQAKEEILKEIASIRFGKEGYIFVNTIDKKGLVFAGKKLKDQKNFSNDANFEKQLSAIKNKNGDFFSLQNKKLDSTEEFPKISFVKSYDKWNWIIGSGLYLNEIDVEINRKAEILKQGIIKQTTTTFFIIVLLIVIVFLISKRISEYFNTNINKLVTAFDKASLNSKEIDNKKFTISEFVLLTNNLNKTLKSRNIAESKLQDYISLVNNHITISSTDEQGIITEVSKAFCDKTGYSKDELIGQTHRIIKHKDMPRKIFVKMFKELKNGKTWRGEIKNRNKFGEAYWEDVIINPNYKNNKLVGFTSIRHDITYRKDVEYLSITDELTKLYNRRFFNTKIEEELNRAKRYNHYISFMMLDIDYFKKYNDTYGHQAGDLALQKVASVLSENTNRASDFVFRLGGEEFGIIFSHDDKIKSLEFANKINKSVTNLKIKHEASEINEYITVSIGLVVKYGLDINNSDNLYKEADEALYNAKNRGRNCVVC